MHDEILADDYFKTAEFCSMSGPKYWPMHNFRGIDWERLGAAVEKQGQGTPSLAGFADSLKTVLVDRSAPEFEDLYVERLGATVARRPSA
jgi:hypothetical protein